MTNYILVVVDMQKMFLNRIENRCVLIDNVAQQIKQAEEDKATIAFLEYDECGATINELKDLVMYYENKSYITKYTDSGAQALANHYNEPKKFKVAGVNTSACVKDTVLGLFNYFPDAEVEIVEQACADGTWNINSHEKAIDYLRNVKNVVVL